MTRATNQTETTSNTASTRALCGCPTTSERGISRSEATATIVATIDAAIVPARRVVTGSRSGVALRHRAVEHLDHMQHGSRAAALLETALDLEHASGIGADDGVRSGRDDRVDLAGEQRVRELGLLQVVRAGAAAAHIRLGHLDELQAFDPAKQRARRQVDALRVREVAGSLI